MDIPENNVLLDEQKLFSEQPEEVQAALRGLGIENLDVMNGREIDAALEERLGSAQEASRALNEAGIKGVTYVGERDGRCFVVFDDKAVQVLDTLYQDGVEGRAEAGPAALEEGTIIGNDLSAEEIATGRAILEATPDAVAYLTDRHAKAMGLPSGGAFVLRIGEEEHATKHLGQIRNCTGVDGEKFYSVDDFVRYVLSDAAAVYQAGTESFVLSVN